MRSRFLWFVAALLSVFVFASLCSAQKQWEVIGDSGWDCKNPAPYGWARTDQSQDTIMATAAHEQDHVKYITEHYKTCGEWNKASAHTSVHVDMEARAYCVEARYWLARGKYPTLPDAVLPQAEALSKGYDFGLTLSQAEEKIFAYCRH